MKKIILFVLPFMLASLSVKSQFSEGDTIFVRVHDATDMTWYGDYNEWAFFPTEGYTFRKITMKYTMGCASSGCSQWDYTTRVLLNHHTPDTLHKIELARVITPYGGYMANGSQGFNNSWKFTSYFDVTDFAPLLKDSVEITAFYDGWSSGFSITLDFEFIVGTPPRNVIRFENLWSGGFNYQDANDFESNYMAPRNVDFLPDEKMARLRFTPTGHGFDNNVNCAEFCIRYYKLLLNGNELARENMWDDKCGLNPIYPQGGTWLYDRANWCPGLKAKTFLHELTGYYTEGQTAVVDIDFQNYIWSGTQSPYYYVDAQLITYGLPNYSLDAELYDILSPSTRDEYARMNPICQTPVIIIRNSGSDTLRSLTITYGIEGATQSVYEWTGVLAFMEVDTLYLERFEWPESGSAIFVAEVSQANGLNDQYSFNNSMKSGVTKPEILAYDAIIVYVQTNTKGWETSYTLKDMDGNLLLERSNLSSSTLYRDTLYLEQGKCHHFHLLDAGKNGLSFWANSDGAGQVSFRRVSPSGFLKSFRPDFGTEISYHFTTNFGLRAEQQTLGGFECFIAPNPVETKLNVQVGLSVPDKISFQIYNTAGMLVLDYGALYCDSGNYKINLSTLPAGVYMLQVSSGNYSQNLRFIKR